MSTPPVYTPDQWNPTLTGYYSILAGGTLFAYNGASHAYSLSAPSPNTIRFELHDGDQAAWDAQMGHLSERDEIMSRGDVAENGTAVDVSYGFTLEQGAANTAKWMVLGQLHQDLDDPISGRSPPVEVALVGERMAVVIHYNDAAGNTVEKTLWTDTSDIDRGHQYQMDIKAIMDPSGNTGRLVVTRDGVIVVDYSGPLNYTTSHGVYWSEGIYRDSAATETVAADYSNLSITTGSSVVLPSTADYIGAPVLNVSGVSAGTMVASTAALLATTSAAATAARAPSYTITLTGTAKVGTTVTVYDGTTAVGTAVTDANGNVSIKVTASTIGTHAYHSIATDATGRSGVASGNLDVVIGTAATIAAQFDTLAKDATIGAIIMTDGNVLNFTDPAALGRALADKAASAAMQAPFQFHLDETITGQTGYDRQVRDWDQNGTLLDLTRYKSGQLVFAQTYNGTTTISKSVNTDQTAQVVTTVGGTVTTLDYLSATGIETMKQTNMSDGGRRLDSFAADGVTVVKSALYAASGSHVDTTYGVTGRNYVIQIAAYDAKGNSLAVGRYDAAGHLVFATDVAAGTNTTYTWNAGGQLTGYRVGNADTSYEITTLDANGHVVSTSYYSAKNVLLKQDQSDPGNIAHAVITTAVAAAYPTTSSTSTPTTPTASVASIAKAGTGFGVALNGTTSAGATVKISEGTTTLGTTTADANGKYSLTVQEAAAGLHTLSATAGGASSSVSVAIASATSVGSLAKTALGAGTLSAAFLIDTGTLATADSTGVLNFASTAALQQFQKAATGLSGTMTLMRATDAVTGQSYDHQSRTVDLAGNEVQLQRYAAGQMVMDNTTWGSITIASANQSDGTTTVSTGVAGSLAAVTTTSGADGRLVSEQYRFADGGREVDNFGSDDTMTSANFTAADGSKVSTTYGITGKDYVKQVAATNTKGTLVEIARFNAAGKITIISDIAHGATETFTYNTSGNETGYRLTQSDHSYSVTKLTASNSTQTTYYDLHGALLKQDASDPGKTLIDAIDAAIAGAHGGATIVGSLIGATGNDTLQAGPNATLIQGDAGNDTLIGGAGDDVLIAGSGLDVMTGGGGKNLFYFGANDFASKTTTGADRITDFSQGDRIDLSSLENSVAGHAGLSFIGTAAFDGKAGEVHSFELNGNTFIAGDLNGDKVADFVIQLDGHHAVTGSNFLF